MEVWIIPIHKTILPAQQEEVSCADVTARVLRMSRVKKVLREGIRNISHGKITLWLLMERISSHLMLQIFGEARLVLGDGRVCFPHEG